MASLRTSIPVLTLLLLLFTFSEAKVFQVGGNENSWNTTTSSESLNHWAENERFEVGDFLSNFSSLSLCVLAFVMIILY
jgi:hypothetical protein